MTLLAVDGLRVHYASDRGTVQALDGVSFTVDGPGEALGIIGESGSGKTTLALSLMRLLPSNAARVEGSIRLGGEDVHALPEERFRRDVRWRRVAMVFQGAMNALNPVLRVGRQIAERPVLEGVSPREALRDARRLLALVGLPPDTTERYPHELSGGMKQRVAIAMALALRPELVILDEPTSALDVSVQAQIMNLLKQLKWDLGLSMVFITHDIALASDLSDRLAVAYGGQLREYGSTDAVLTGPLDPYTQVLLASVPRLRAEEPPRPLPGAPPAPTAPPAGCRFHPRCPRAFAPCPTRRPPLLEPRPGHHARCWLYDGTPR
jgi:oligopeptide/dipeptide ABC transporter ATP-binding protein